MKQLIAILEGIGGTLRLLVRAVAFAPTLPRQLPRFMEQHPKVIVYLSLNDALVDLLDESTDVAIRHGPLHDSALHARQPISLRAMFYICS